MGHPLVARGLFWLAAAVLGIPALGLTVVRLVDSDVGTMIRVQSFTPFGIPLYAALLLLLAFGVVRRPAGRRTRRFLGALAALAGLGLHLWWFSPQVVGDTPAPGAHASTLTVMNANIYANKGDPVQLVEEARRANVDVLVVQEITEWALSRMDNEAGLAQLLPYRIGTPDGGVAGTMVFANQRLGTPERLPTMFQGWRVAVGSLTLVAAHPVAPVAPTGADQWRSEHRMILEAAVDAEADLIVGDLNASPDHSVMRDYDDAGYRDTAELDNQGWQPTWPANHAGIIPWLSPVVRIDHVLVGPELTATDSWTVDIEGTDHLAVVAAVARR